MYLAPGGAHLRMGEALFAAGDTAAALDALALAAEVSAGEPNVLFRYAQVQAGARQLDGAVANLRRAITGNPDYAMPYLLLGRILEARGEGEDAKAAYRAFLAHAARRHEARPVVEGWLAAPSAGQ